MGIDLSRAGCPFEDQDQMLDSFSEILDLHIYYLYKYHSWVSPNNSMQNMLGVVVSREEFESNLLRASDTVAYGSLTDEETEELDTLREYFLARYNATVTAGADFPLIKLGKNFSMDFFEYAVTLTLYISESYIALIEADKRNPSMDIMVKLAEKFHVTADYLINGTSMDAEETSIREWSELIRGRSDKEIAGAIALVKTFFSCIDDID